jgi:annexin A7/11
MSLQPYYETPTLRDGPFDPMADAQALRKAMKGFGTDEKAIINVLAKRTNNQRLQIANSYKQSFGKDLVADLKSEVSGKFEEILVAMMTPRYDYMAERLHDAMSGIGTKEMVLIDILCTASNQDLRWIQASYARLYRNQLEQDIANDTSGHFKRLLVSLCVAQRSEDTRIDPGLVQQDAQALYNAGMKQWGTDESVFNMVMAARSHAHLREVFHEYEKVAGQDIERTINAEFSGDIKDAMNAIVKSVKNRAAYFAQRLKDAMKGMGTNDGLLIFLIVTRAEVDLENIKTEYNRLYNKSLAQDIKSDTGGDYQKTLLTLVVG